ncbi:MAG TPA: hypothetical protein VHE37_08725, partial [Nevskiaceae bacterium]|nr:hypothetical protein [Nevskiaceae bacterium]
RDEDSKQELTVRICPEKDSVCGDYERNWCATCPKRPAAAQQVVGGLTFEAFRRANKARCVKWHPAGIASWSPSDWLTAVTGELGELASLLKMRNRERDGLPGNKFSPTQKQIADELADVLTYLDLLAEVLGIDLGQAAVSKFNEVSERVGFPDRLVVAHIPPPVSSVPVAELEALRAANAEMLAILVNVEDDHYYRWGDGESESDAIAHALRAIIAKHQPAQPEDNSRVLCACGWPPSQCRCEPAQPQGGGA